MRPTIAEATETALAAFWDSIAKQYPAATTGDLNPYMAANLTETANNAVRQWISFNDPTCMLLTICTDENQIEVTREDAPELFQAWDAWLAAERGSNIESHAWTRVIDAASSYLDDEQIEDVRA